MQQLGQAKDEMKRQGRRARAAAAAIWRGSRSPSNQRDAARKLQEAAGTIRDQMIKEKIEYSKDAMASGAEYSKPIESEIASNLDTVRQKIGEAAGAADAGGSRARA